MTNQFTSITIPKTVHAKLIDHIQLLGIKVGVFSAIAIIEKIERETKKKKACK